MSLFALYKTRQAPTRAEIGDALSGNLCRCTGYRPIVDAGVKMYEHGSDREDRHQHWMNCSFSSGTDREVSQSEREMIERLRAIARRDTLVVRHDKATFYAPVTLKDLAALREEHPDARLLAGGTDVGLWVTKQHKDLPTIIYVGDVAELKEIRDTETGLEIGAAANLTDAYEALVARHPELSELYRRFASPPIRNAGTLGGNIANGSPIGDSMPALIVMGAMLVLRKGKRAREIPLDALLSSPIRRRRSRRASSSSAFACRHRAPGTHLRTFKISKRFDQDISAVCGAFQHRGSIAVASPRRGSRTAAWRPRRSARQRPSTRSSGATGASDGARGDGRARRRLHAAHRHARVAAAIGRASRATCSTSSGSRRPAPRRRRRSSNSSPEAGNDAWTSIPPAAQARPIPHDSAHLHVSGEALYIDDIPEVRGTLHAAIGLSERAHARIKSIDLAKVRAAPGVVAVLTAKDVPGKNDYGPVVADDPIFATTLVQYVGQSIFAVAARTVDEARARRAARRRRIRGPEADSDGRGRRARAVVRAADRADAARQSGGRDRLVAASAVGSHPHRRPGAVLPRRDDRVRGTEGRRHDARLQLDAASRRDPASGRACARRRRQRRRRRLPAHGRRIRRQGEPAGTLRLHRRAVRAEASPPREAARRPRRRHADHRQAPRLRHRLRRRLRRRRPHPRRRVHAGRALRLFGRPVRIDQRPRDVPQRQLLLPGRCRHHELPLQDEHAVEHRVPRLRRAAGHDRHRAGRRRDRALPREGSARRAPAAISTARRSATSPTITRPSSTT